MRLGLSLLLGSGLDSFRYSLPPTEPDPSPEVDYAARSDVPTGTSLGAFTGTIGEVVMGDKPLNNLGVPLEILTKVGDVMYIGKDW